MADSVKYTEPGAGTQFAVDTVETDKVVQWSKDIRPGVASVIRIDANAVSQEALAANALRLKAKFYNDGSVPAFVKEGEDAAADDFTHKILPGDSWKTKYTGRVDVIWQSGVGDITGGMQVTEETYE